MRVGIDTYTYHRRFGEVRPSESPVDTRWTTADAVARCVELGVDGISLETCYLEGTSDPEISALRRMLDEAGLDRVLAWGHPGGLELGRSPERFADALRAVDHAVGIGAELLRIVVGTTAHFGSEDEAVVVERLSPLVAELTEYADDHGLPVAIETHCDLTVDGLLQLVEDVDRPGLGVVFDTANVIRIGDDLIRAAEVLAPHTRMLHVKDLDLAASAEPGDPAGWWPCLPLGTGDLDLTDALRLFDSAGFVGLACVEVADVPAGTDEDAIAEESVRWLRATMPRSRVPGG
ncbi:MAG: sugar phosphate isomerase/epimerase family protein [Acidimicrobiales bacterium]